MLIEVDPACFWPFAIAMSFVFGIACTMPWTTGNSPYYTVTGETPSLNNHKVFGCRAQVLILPTTSNFEPRAKPGVGPMGMSFIWCVQSSCL
jgi:hypothetical protein